MRKKIQRSRLAACLLALVLLLGLTVPCAPAHALGATLPKNYRTIAENGRFIVGLDTSTCFFCVADKQLGRVYYSNPEDWKSDALATGSAKTKLRSQLTVSVLHSADQWFGMTYHEDRPRVAAALQKLHDAGVYPDKLA